MNSGIFIGLMVPFLGTSLGSACVFLMKNKMRRQVERALTGFASGVMVAASVWSLLVPAMEQSDGMGRLAFLPAFVGFWAGNSNISAGAALALSLGIAIQNFPEGAIISMPLAAEGKSKKKAFIYGVLSGAVEPVFGFLTILAVGFIVPAMPYLLSFAAGAMLYVVVEELIPEMSEGEHSNIGVVMFAVGFTCMMALDVALG